MLFPGYPGRTERENETDGEAMGRETQRIGEETGELGEGT